jgi:hypothetical protein
VRTTCREWRSGLRSALIMSAIAACCGVVLVAQSGGHIVDCDAHCDRPDSHVWTAARPDGGSEDPSDDDDDDNNDDAAGALLAPASTSLTADHSQTALQTRSECDRPRSLESDGHLLRGPPQSGLLDFGYALHRGHPDHAFSLSECIHLSGDPERVALRGARVSPRPRIPPTTSRTAMDDPSHGDGSGRRRELGRLSFVSDPFSIPRQRSVNERRAE